MLSIFKSIKPNKTYECSGFCSHDAMTTENYAELMNNAVFALCPPGQDSMDSFRLYESLEAGCIPVALTRTNRMPIYPSYWEAVIQNTGVSTIPFILCDTWEECAAQMQTTLKDKDYKQTQKKCLDFWLHIKRQWKQIIKTKLTMLHP